MLLTPSIGLPAYKIPPEIKKQSWAKKKKGRRKKVKGVPRNISEIYKK